MQMVPALCEFATYGLVVPADQKPRRMHTTCSTPCHAETTKPFQPVGTRVFELLGRSSRAQSCLHQIPPANVAACSSDETREARYCKTASAISAGTSLCFPWGTQDRAQVMTAQDCNDCKAIRIDLDRIVPAGDKVTRSPLASDREH